MKNTLGPGGPVTTSKLRRCHKIMAQIAQAKKSILEQFKEMVAGYERLLWLALNEAEALAWQTRYPHLVFQDLAEEKAWGLADWVVRQRLVRSGGLHVA